MKIFLTGGSGFVGGAVAKELSARHEIVALSRSEKSDAVLRGLGVATVRGDLASADAAMLAGCEAVIHCAAFVEEWGPYSAYEEINVGGTERLLAAAKAASVGRFVHVGTEAALFYGQHMRDIDETYPLAPQSPFPYSRTKALAEAAVRGASGAGFETIVIRPRLVWGEGDKTVLPVVRDMAANGAFAWIDGGAVQTSTTHIDNLVAAIELGLSCGKPGEAYFIVDGPPVTFRDFLTAYLATAGTTLPDKSVPGWLARGLAFVLEPVYRLAGSERPPPLTRFTANIMSRDCTIRDEKARADLGYRPVISVEDGLKRLAG